MKKFKRKANISSSVLYLANWVAPRATGSYVAKLFMTPYRHQRPDWESLLLKKSQRVEIPSNRKVWSWGTRGPRILLVHGWEGRGTQLGAFVEPLVNAGYQVIAWDGPAHGDTPGKSTHLAEFSRALREDIAALGPFEAVVAHSMGAAALMLAAEEGLVLGKAILIASPSQWKPAMQMLAKRFRLRDATLRSVLSFVEKEVGRPMEDFDVQNWQNKHKTSLLILHDEKDKDVPASEFSRLKDAYPRAKGKLFSGLGHRKILKDPEVISEVLNFIKEAA